MLIQLLHSSCPFIRMPAASMMPQPASRLTTAVAATAAVAFISFPTSVVAAATATDTAAADSSSSATTNAAVTAAAAAVTSVPRYLLSALGSACPAEDPPAPAYSRRSTQWRLCRSVGLFQCRSWQVRSQYRLLQHRLHTMWCTSSFPQPTHLRSSFRGATASS